MGNLILYKNYRWWDIGKDFETTYMIEQRKKYTFSFWTEEEKKIRKETLLKCFGGIYRAYYEKLL